jgi:UDP-N-acetylglucosamine 2-epimerase (non-hydrolysing)
MQYKRKICVVFVVGTRPNFIKVAPIIKQMELHRDFKTVLIHTGQHFDYEMSRLFFKDLNIRKPDYNLDINESSHAVLTARMIAGLERKFFSIKPDLVLVVGDVDSTLAAALAAVKIHIPIAHVEAGLRSYDMLMPEETNRIITDRLSDFLFIHSPEAKKNLVREGISSNKIFYVGNVMIDMLKAMLNKVDYDKYLKIYNLKKRNYALLTLHRPSNVDNKKIFESLLRTIAKISRRLPVIFPIHPRSKLKIKNLKLEKVFKNSHIIATSPLGYAENLGLLKNAKFVLTDSGGIQEETTYLRIPCLTLRENTERPITVGIGTNTIVGTDSNKILSETEKILNSNYKIGKIPKYWDGKTSERIVKILKGKLSV